MRLLLVFTLLGDVILHRLWQPRTAESLQPPVWRFVVVSLLLLLLKSPEIEEQSSDSVLSILILIQSSMQEAGGSDGQYSLIQTHTLASVHCFCSTSAVGNNCAVNIRTGQHLPKHSTAVNPLQTTTAPEAPQGRAEATQTGPLNCKTTQQSP